MVSKPAFLMPLLFGGFPDSRVASWTALPPPPPSPPPSRCLAIGPAGRGVGEERGTAAAAETTVVLVMTPQAVVCLTPQDSQ